MKNLDYKKYRLKKIVDLIKFCVVLSALFSLIIFAPSQATQATGYIGMFLLGGSKARGIMGL